ncbi:MAG: glyoxalase [Cypionkella sp.]|nr:glyoxalase [Cypionkella sp.]
MDYANITGAEFGRAMTGISINLLTRDVRAEAAFLAQVFGCDVPRLTDDDAIVVHAGMAMQLHSDASFAAHPLHALLPEAGPRGSGMEIRLHGVDPDAACARAAQFDGAMVLAAARDKAGHGLREAVILSPSGYAFVPSVLL